MQSISDLITKGRLKTERLKAKARTSLKPKTAIPKPQNATASEQRYKVNNVIQPTFFLSYYN